MSVGASLGAGAWGQYLGKKKILQRFTACSILTNEEGLRLLPMADSLVVEGLDGIFSQHLYSYLFHVDGLAFYFESSDRIILEDGIQIEKMELPN